MSFKAAIKAQKAYQLQGKGDVEGAKALYEEAISMGMTDVRYWLAYALLLIRGGEYAKAREYLVKIQKMPGLTPEQRTDLFVDYACCVFRMGEIDKGISLLERQHQKQPSGLIYQTLGYLYCEKYDASVKDATIEAWAAEDAAKAQEHAEKEESSENEAAPVGTDDADEEKPAVLTPEGKWDAGCKKGLDFNLEAVDYDDEDPVCLDNMGQYYYRVMGDKETAFTYFTKAISIKEGQIDTLYFLSRYDLDDGDTEAALEKLEKALEGRFSPLNYCNKEKIQLEIARIKAAQ